MKKENLFFICKCDCGNTKNILSNSVLRGLTKSCGCLERESRFNRIHTDNSIIGKRFGNLTVIKDSGKKAPNNSVLWECLCDCGNITYSNSSNLKRGHTTSCGSNIEKYVDSKRFKNVIGKKYNYLTPIEELPRENYSRRTFKCKCDCGNTTVVALSALTTNQIISCGCIAQSNGEALVEKILKQENIRYEKEKIFPDCKDKRELPFDFYLPDYNTCIEYDGKQHYVAVNWFGGENGFQNRVRHDRIKTKYCKDHNMKLIRIPYNIKSDENLKGTILNYLNP